MIDERTDLVLGEEVIDTPQVSDGWREYAACASLDPTDFFPELSPLPSVEVTAHAKEICSQCAVRAQCLGHALSNNEEFGVWGGLTARERSLLTAGDPIRDGFQLEITPQGLTVARADLKAIHAFQPRINSLLHVLADAPDSILKIHPREFEELVAELLKSRGYGVELTRETRDGGVDIFATKTSDLGDDLLFLVQCKRYQHPVGAPAVRDLVGVVTSCKATGGVLVTSSFFTSEAKKFASTLPHQITLRDYVAVQGWIEQAVVKNRTR